MSRTELLYYPNLSAGGITSVIRGRAVSYPTTSFDLIFSNDRNGGEALVDLPNVDYRVIEQSRLENYLKYRIKEKKYDEIAVLSSPRTANLLSSFESLVVNYEFHSSDQKVISREIEQLELENLSSIYVPSVSMLDIVQQLLPRKHRSRAEVKENIVDFTIFKEDGPSDFFSPTQEAEIGIPLVWVGRFDEGKGYRHLIRLMAKLPRQFSAHVVVSLESGPDRATKFLTEAEALGVADRTHLYLNLGREDVARLYRSAKRLGGRLVSVSLMESYGYSVAEGLKCGLPVVAYSLPAFQEFEGDLRLVPIGDIQNMASVLLSE